MITEAKAKREETCRLCKNEIKNTLIEHLLMNCKNENLTQVAKEVNKIKDNINEIMNKKMNNREIIAEMVTNKWYNMGKIFKRILVEFHKG